MKSVSKTHDDSAIRILKTASCPSLSGKSKLTYHIGCTDKSEIQFRVVANSNPGCFNQNWVTLQAIEAAFEKSPPNEPITAVLFDSLFRGKSLNTPFFLFAALKNEGLVRAAKENQRGYERIDSRDFKTKIQALIKSTATLQTQDKPKKNTGKQVGSGKTSSLSKQRQISPS